jgi:ubiquitin carboxyl-terminal hydrolase 22/27/51
MAAPYASDLARYEQHDAHEFFISIFDQIHDNLLQDQQSSNKNGEAECCIVHRVFSGIMRPAVTCTYCSWYEGVCYAGSYFQFGKWR